MIAVNLFLVIDFLRLIAVNVLPEIDFWRLVAENLWLVNDGFKGIWYKLNTDNVMLLIDCCN